MKRQRTVPLSKEAVDFMVLEYSCIDNTVLSTIGKHCKETAWKIVVGSDSAPIDITLHVDKNVMSSPQVRIDWDGTKIFPRGNSAKERLKEDFTWCVPYRGIVKGLAVKNRFEIRPEFGGGDAWFAATLTDQRHDGLFRAIAQMPDGKGGTKEVSYPAVKAENIREADGMKKAIEVPRRNLVLQVPQLDPLHAVLSVDSGELITHFFVRPTPPPAKDANNGASLVKPRILLKVSKDRERVTSDAGHEIFSHFLQGGVRAVGEEVARWRKTWMLQVGPFAEHTIEIERRYKSNKVMSLTVDGDILCESAAEDIDSRPGWWECSFRLEGEKYLDWEVHETDLDGQILDSIDLVRQKQKCCYECVVSVPECEKDFSGAQLIIDDVDFAELQQSRAMLHGDKIDCSPEGLQHTYDLRVPHKVNEKAPRSLYARAQEWTNNIRRESPPSPPGNDSGLSFLARCCGRPQVERHDDIIKPPRRGSSKDL